MEHNIKIFSFQYVWADHGVYQPSADTYWEECILSYGVAELSQLVEAANPSVFQWPASIPTTKTSEEETKCASNV